MYLYGDRRINLAMSTYADDICRLSQCASWQDSERNITAINHKLDDSLDTLTLAQNREKQDHVVFFSGKNSKANNCELYGSERLPGHTRASARYLDGRQHFKGNMHKEVDLRLSSAQRCWLHVGAFWVRGTEGRRGKLFTSHWFTITCCQVWRLWSYVT